MSIYDILLFVHSWLRWVVLILALLVLVRSFSGWLGKKSFEKLDLQGSKFFTISMHTQLLLGLILYFFLSPLGVQAFENGMGAVMKNGALRYWAVEHIFTMILAVVLVQIGASRSKRASTALQKHKNLAIFTLIGLILILSRIPWDQAGRMFRGL